MLATILRAALGQVAGGLGLNVPITIGNRNAVDAGDGIHAPVTIGNDKVTRSRGWFHSTTEQK